MSSRQRVNKDVPVLELKTGIEQAQASGTSATEVIKTLNSAKDMFDRRYEFTANACSDHSAMCEKIETMSYEHDWKTDFDQGKTPYLYGPKLLCGKEVGQYLKSFVSIQRAKRILEVGMFTGYSSMCMAEALPADGEIVCLDICEHLKHIVEEVTQDSRHAKKIKIIIGPARETMKKMVETKEQFDIIFLDGDKKDYIPLFKMIFEENLLSKDGTLLIDNAYCMGFAYNPAKNNPLPQQIQDVIKGWPNLHTFLLPISDGLYVVRRMEDVERDTV